jgi:hypothetical protein
VPDEEYIGTHRKPDEPETMQTGPDAEPSQEAHPSEPLATSSEPDAEPESQPHAEPDAEPSQEAHPPEPLATSSEPQSEPESKPDTEPDSDEESEPESEEEQAAPSEPLPAPAQPVMVPGQYDYLKRWRFVLVMIGVWILALPIGLGLYYWWYHSIDKTPAVFVVMVYVVVCTVCGLLTAMVDHKPLVSAVAIALLSAPFWSVAAAAVLHGVYFCEHASRCLVGLIPY